MKKVKLKIKDLNKLISERALIMLEAELDDMPPSDKTSDEEVFFNNDADDSIENIGDMQVDRGDDIDADVPEAEENGYTHLGLAIEKLASRIDEPFLMDLNDEIEKAIKTGRVSKDFTFTRMITSGKDKAAFDYFLSVLGALYKQSSGTDKSNIRSAIFLALPVYAVSSYEKTEGNTKSSTLTNLVAKKAGIGALMHKSTIDASYYLDIVADSIYNSIDYALENYSPDKGTFSALVIIKASNLAKDELSSKLHKKTFAAGGLKQSLDEPFGDEENAETSGDRLTGKEGDVSSTEKEAVKNFAGALKSFVTDKLSQKASLKNYLDFFNYFSAGNNLSETADLLGVSDGNVRVIKSRMEDFITKFVESGELQEYIKNKTGMKVDFPNNRFSLSVNGTKKGEGTVEPVEYFNVTGNDPQTGDPEGEWLTISPATHDSETSWFDSYGEIAMRGDAETHVRDNSNGNSEEEENIEEPEVSPITESLVKFIKNTLDNEK